MGENRVAVISVIVEDRTIASSINAILSEFGEYIVGRMGVPYKAKHISVMCVIADAPAEVLNGLTGNIGGLKGVTSKTLMVKIWRVDCAVCTAVYDFAHNTLQKYYCPVHMPQLTHIFNDFYFKRRYI